MLAPDARVVLIAGGQGKGQDFSPLRAPLPASARALVLIGRDAALIEQAVTGQALIENAAAGSGPGVLHAASMPEAVQLAAAQARPGDAVLLSPACASFDMFRDYKHRGEVFTAAVKELAHA